MSPGWSQQYHLPTTHLAGNTLLTLIVGFSDPRVNWTKHDRTGSICKLVYILKFKYLNPELESDYQMLVVEGGPPASGAVQPAEKGPLRRKCRGRTVTWLVVPTVRLMKMWLPSNVDFTLT